MYSEETDVDLPRADLFWDSVEGSYIAFAYFFWDGENWREDCPSGTYYEKNVGGRDGFGLAFDRPINRYTQVFKTWYNDGTMAMNTYTPQAANSYGVGFNKQDIAYNSASQYNWDSGLIMVYMMPQQTGVRYCFWQEMGHTWSTVDISGIGVGVSGITFSFTSGNSRWEAIAPVSGVYTF